ncbi:MAG: tetratricopeptide repeat protein [Myxococcaceae bacterium]
MFNRRSWSAEVFSLCLLTLPLVAWSAPGPEKIPVTTVSEEARQFYLQGRDANEKLRATDAYLLFEKAVAKDAAFALGYLGLANSAPTNKTFFAALSRAVALSDKVTEGERLMILGLNAGATGDVDGQRRMYEELVAKYPADERALTLLGNYYFGLQDYPAAIRYLTQATEIAPNFTTPYNQLGYAFRFEGKYPEAEKTFKKYIELLPGDPNPYDSYGELLMKMGRFDESVVSYRKALEIDPHFIASFIGIANDQMFQGNGDEARKTLRQMAGVARNDGERRQALFWTAQSYVLEGRSRDAIRAVGEERAIAQKSGDLSAQSGDATFLGNILLHAGQLDAAAGSFAEANALMAKAAVPAEVKEANRRNSLFNTARVALKRGDLKTAQAQAELYRSQVAAKQIPFEVWQVHELLGMVAIAQRDYERALAELAKSSGQNPRVLYLTAVALQGKGDAQRAQLAAQAVANFNALNVAYVFVRPEAQKMATGS